jgi:putative tryptophan/tyrosine transport system substrate-binding protein
MKRRKFMGLIGGTALAWPLSALSQSTGRSGRLSKIGILITLAANDPDWLQRLAALRKGLQELGWEEGKNFTFEIRYAAGSPDRLSAAAAELVSTGPNVLVTGPAGLATLLRNVTRIIPIVTMSAGELEGTGLIASLRRPGGNVTGNQMLSPDLMSKRLDLLRQMIPNLTRIGFVEPITAAGTITPRYIEVTLEAARALRIEVHRVEIKGPDDVETAFASIARQGGQAALVVSNPLSVVLRKEITSAAVRTRVPTHYEIRAFVAAGGLISYGPDLVHLSGEASKFVDKILRGANPAELPVQQPTKFELAINIKTANALGLTVPSAMLAQADEVIE